MGSKDPTPRADALRAHLHATGHRIKEETSTALMSEVAKMQAWGTPVMLGCCLLRASSIVIASMSWGERADNPPLPGAPKVPCFYMQEAIVDGVPVLHPICALRIGPQSAPPIPKRQRRLE